MKNIQVLCLRLTALWLLCSQVGVHADIALITHKDNPLQTLAEADARRIFLRQTSEFPDGSRAVPAMLYHGSNLRGEFEKNVLGMSPSQLKAYWARFIFSGQKRPPQEFTSPEAMKQWVASSPGSLGYVHVGDVDDTVKVLITVASDTAL